MQFVHQCSSLALFTNRIGTKSSALLFIHCDSLNATHQPRSEQSSALFPHLGSIGANGATTSAFWARLRMK